MNNPLKPIQKYFDSLRDELSEYLKKVKRPEFWALGVLLLVWLIVEAPRWQASRVTSTDAEKYFQVENEARKTILQGLGGGFFFVTAYFAWRQVQVAEKNREIADKTRQAAESKQVTERFVKAAEMLADEKDRLEVKAAGIYALERIANDSEDDYWTVMEVLTLLIKDKTGSRHVDPEQGKLPPFPKDLQVALTVIGRRDVKKDGDRILVFDRTDLIKAHLSGGTFSGASFVEANLFQANLGFANLIDAHFMRANLRETNFLGADLIRASFTGASLSRAKLGMTNLKNASLKETDLCDACLRGAYLRYADLEGATLNGADLTDVCLRGTDFRGADLRGTKLNGADLRGAYNLKREQVLEAEDYPEAVYDLDFAEKLGLDKDKQIRMAKEWDKLYKSHSG